MRRAYQASGKVGDGAIPVLVLACAGAAVAVGAIEGFVSQWFSLFIVFPALVGAAAGIAGTMLVEQRHIRAPVLAAAIAGVAGMLGQVAVHGVDYWRFRHAVAEQLASDGDNTPDAVDQALIERTGSPGFLGYAKFMAEQGTEIKRTGHDSGTTFTGIGWWILSGVEALIAALVAAVMVGGRAREPYCESCGRWFDAAQVEGVGSGEKAAVAAVKSALDSEAWSRAVEALGEATPKRVSSIAVRRCGQCQSHEPQLELRVTVGADTRKAKTSTAYTTVMRYEDYQTLHTALAARAPAP